LVKCGHPQIVKINYSTFWTSEDLYPIGTGEEEGKWEEVNAAQEDYIGMTQNLMHLNSHS